MDINKWKSVAINYVDHQARKLKVPNAVYRTKLLNGEANVRSKKDKS